VNDDPSILEGQVERPNIAMASSHLQGTYIVRLFSEFETALQHFIRAFHIRKPRGAEALVNPARDRGHISKATFGRGSPGARVPKRPGVRAFDAGQSRHDQGGDSLPMHFFEQAPKDLVIRPLCKGRACYDIMTSNKSLFLVERPLAI
jgi:hypothetical protein